MELKRDTICHFHTKFINHIEMVTKPFSWLDEFMQENELCPNSVATYEQISNDLTYIVAISIPKGGIIFTDGTLTEGQKFCSKTMREWIDERNSITHLDGQFIDL